MADSPNANYIGLTWRDGVTMNGEPEDFYIAGGESAERAESARLKHTAEPWATFFTDDEQGRPTQYYEANAKRAVACVNACAGIKDPADLRKQRDELLRELEVAVSLLDCANDHQRAAGRLEYATSSAREVIAATKAHA